MTERELDQWVENVILPGDIKPADKQKDKPKEEKKEDKSEHKRS